MNYIVNNNPKVSRITSMGFLNAHDLTLLLTGTGKNQNYPLHRGVTFFLCWDTCKWMRTNWRGRLENHLASFARQFQFNTESTKVVSQITRLKLYFKNGVGKLKLWERLQRPWLDLSYCSFSTATVTWTSFYVCPPLKIFAICLNFIHCFGVVDFCFFFVLIFSFYVWFLFFFFRRHCSQMMVQFVCGGILRERTTVTKVWKWLQPGKLCLECFRPLEVWEKSY